MGTITGSAMKQWLEIAAKYEEKQKAITAMAEDLMKTGLDATNARYQAERMVERRFVGPAHQ